MISPFVVPDAGAAVVSDLIDSPVGELLLTGTGDALSGVYFLDGRYRGPDGLARDPAAFSEVKSQLEAYFGGELTEFDLRLAPSGSPFQLAVWEELTRIPYGATTSYGAIARALGKSQVASRAVGAANGRNPIPIIVPCHRVIGADGGLTGYGGGLDRKLTLLKIEGSAGLW
ncbi:MAG TPA: methylated-DNA--[protein]-cysteine S-methyltransferase [Streptosporangiaceae bacterium]|nr:methylated-DNA--[protein]-cysteine S-methyltransferase [Streptosporangiaceae bacterium]